tara:strand:- start:6736 stop:7119 length:384 start_codon:yes stop_codon:yes gene_type:complete
MSFFSDDDIEQAIKNMGEVPDGLIDNTNYVDLFAAHVECIDSLDINDEESRLTYMMRIVNMVGDPSDEDFEVRTVENATCMTFHIINLLQIGSMMKDDFVEMYVDSLRNEVLPQLNQDKGAMPYWNN